MRRQPSLRSQLNQIRMWVRQGRTDPWIAHKLDVSVDELGRFKREHGLDADDEGTRARPADAMSVPAPEPRFEALDEPDEEEEEEAEDLDEPEPERERPRSRSRSRRRPRRPAAVAADEDEDDEDEDEAYAAEVEPDDAERDEGDADGGPRRRRRRGRRGGRRHRTRRHAYEATFDHGGEGYGLWLDPAVADNPVYSEHWAGHRAVTVTFEAEAITIRRADSAEPQAPADEDD